MIQRYTYLNVADNSGAKKGSMYRYSRRGEKEIRNSRRCYNRHR
jgi:ribosomal protein L14